MNKTIVVAGAFALVAALAAAPAFAQPAGPPPPGVAPPPGAAPPPRAAAPAAPVVEAEAEEPEIVWEGFGYICTNAPEGAPRLLDCYREVNWPPDPAPAGGPPPGGPPPGGPPPA